MMKASPLVSIAVAALLAGCATSGTQTRTAGKPAPLPPPSNLPAGSSRYGHPGETIYDFPPGGYEAHQRQKQQAAAQHSQTGPVVQSASPSAKSASGPRIYIVQAGDSLWKIAQKHGATPAQIRAANSLPGDIIKPGQRLVIP